MFYYFYCCGSGWIHLYQNYANLSTGRYLTKNNFVTEPLPSGLSYPAALCGGGGSTIAYTSHQLEPIRMEMTVQDKEVEQDEEEDVHICGACKARFQRYPAFVQHKAACRLRKTRTQAVTPRQPEAKRSEAAKLTVNKLNKPVFRTVQQEGTAKTLGQTETVAFQRVEEEEEEEDDVEELEEESMEIVTMDESSSSVTFYVRSSRDSPPQSRPEGRLWGKVCVAAPICFSLRKEKHDLVFNNILKLFDFSA